MQTPRPLQPLRFFQMFAGQALHSAFKKSLPKVLLSHKPLAPGHQWPERTGHPQARYLTQPRHIALGVDQRGPHDGE